MESFFYKLYDFHNPVVNAPAFVPAELPPRYAISFVPAISVPPVQIVSSPVANAPVIVSSLPTDVALLVPSSADFSVISSANFVPVFTSHSCIGTTQ